MTEQEAHKVNELFKQIDELNSKYTDSLETIKVLNDKIVEYADIIANNIKCCNEDTDK
tara:strand:+ start:548 stop:721 length:174 start_codon:yes stop_codon:yes gene_type:complete